MDKCIRFCRKIPLSRGMTTFSRRKQLMHEKHTGMKIQLRKESTSSSSSNSYARTTFIGVIIGGTVYSLWKFGVFSKQEKSLTSDAEPEVVIAEEAKAKADADAAAEAETSGEAGGEVTTPELPAIPAHVQYLLIGAGTASFSAAQAIKVNDTKAQILIVGAEDHLPYKRPPLSKELWFSEDRELVKNLGYETGDGERQRRLSIFHEKQAYYAEPKMLPTLENGGIAVLKGHRVVKLETWTKTAHLDNGTKITFDKCLIATGGKPRNLPVLEKASKEVKDRTILFRTINDFQKLDSVAQSSKSVAIIGGGFLGSELACALGHKSKSSGLKVYQIFPEKGNMGRVFPEYLSKWTTKKLESEGVNVITERFVKSVSFQDDQVHLKLDNGDVLPADHVVVAVGLEPNTDLAKTSGLEVDDVYGGYRVNAELEARSNIWVAGDASCFYDIKLGRRRVEHYDHARVSGRLAGRNMTGARMPYWHQSMFWSDLGPNIAYEAIGIVDSSLETVAVFAKATEKDTPKAAAEKSGEGLRSEAEKGTLEKIPETPVQSETAPSIPTDTEDYEKGVIFYLKDNIIVGMLFLNVYGYWRMAIARQVLHDGGESEDLFEVAKLFDIYV